MKTFSTILSACLLLVPALALPLQAASAASPVVDDLSKLTAALSDASSHLETVGTGPYGADQFTREFRGIVYGVDQAAASIEAGTPLTLMDAVSLSPVLPALIANAVSLVTSIQDKQKDFQPVAMYQSLDQAYKAVNRLRTAISSKVPSSLSWIVSGFSGLPLLTLAGARDAFRNAATDAAAPPAYAAQPAYPAQTYPAVPFAVGNAPATPAAGYAQPQYVPAAVGDASLSLQPAADSDN